MKKYVLFIKYAVICTLPMLWSGCDIAGLEFQEDEEYQYHVLDPKIDMTALDFLNQPREDTLFELMRAGVAYANLEEEYTQPDRTFLFVTNDAILAYNEDGTLNPACFFAYNTVNGEPATRWEDYPVEVVRDFFLYHIVEGTYSYDNLTPENTQAATLLDHPVYLKIMNARNSKLRVNDRPFTTRFVEARTSNIQATNGVIHVFDGFVEPSTL